MGSTIATKDAKAAQAAELRTSGMSWATVAKTCGFKTALEAAGAVRAYQRRASYLVDTDTKTEMLRAELERLDALQFAVWADAMTGDPSAVNSALKIIGLRSKLLGLDVETAPVNQTVVVTGDTSDYVRSLRVVSGEE